MADVQSDKQALDRERLIHELEVHQSELETQNQQLREAQQLLEDSRATYADLYDFAPIAYCSIDERSVIVQVNLAGATLLGRERGRLIGAEIGAFVDPGDRRKLRSFVLETIAAGGAECKLLEVAVGDRLVRVMGKIAADARSGRRICQAALLDITAQKQAESTLRLALRMREDFLAIVSHDLRNPLNSILLGAELLLREQPTEERRRSGRRQLEVIRQASERMNRLLSDLLDLSSMDAGHLSLDVAAHEASSLTQTAMEILTPLALDKGVELRSDVAVGNAQARCDRERTVQVLLNLIGNALKFTPAGGRILVAVDRRGEELVWSVRDTGIGMSREQQQRIFEAYWKADRLSRKGTGLGLSIARGIIERQGGKIWVDSKIGSGSTFFFSLPAAQAEKHADSTTASLEALRKAPASSAQLAGRAVLIVDDEDDTRETLAELLRLEGYRVVTAANGRDALARLEREGVFLILLDLVMPEMDGWELLRELKKRESLAKIPVILISGQVNAPQVAESMGLAGSIEKPIELTALREALTRSQRDAASLRN